MILLFVKQTKNCFFFTYPVIATDEPVRIRNPTAVNEPLSQILYIRGLTRPFSLLQLKELLCRYGTLVEGKFWLDKIKSQCFVTVRIIISLKMKIIFITYIYSILHLKTRKMLVKVLMVVDGHQQIRKHYLSDLVDRMKYSFFLLFSLEIFTLNVFNFSLNSAKHMIYHPIKCQKVKLVVLSIVSK